MLQYAVIVSMIHFVPHLVKIPDFSIDKSARILRHHALRMVWYRGLQFFHKLFATHRLSYLIERFRILIRLYKWFYSTALLSSLCVPWPIGVFYDCSVSSTVAFWQQFWHINKFQRVFKWHSMLTHNFTSIQLYNNVWRNQSSLR